MSLFNKCDKCSKKSDYFSVDSVELPLLANQNWHDYSYCGRPRYGCSDHPVQRNRRFVAVLEEDGVLRFIEREAWDRDYPDEYKRLSDEQVIELQDRIKEHQWDLMKDYQYEIGE